MSEAFITQLCETDSALIVVNQKGEILSIEQGALLFGIEDASQWIGQSFSTLLASPFSRHFESFFEQSIKNVHYRNLIAARHVIVDAKHFGTTNNKVNSGSAGSTTTISVKVNFTEMSESTWIVFITKENGCSSNLSTDSKGNIITSSNVHNLFGYSFAELKEQNLSILLPQYDFNQLIGSAAISTSIKDSLARHKDGQIFHVAIQTKTVKLREYEVFIHQIQKLDPSMEASFTIDSNSRIIEASNSTTLLFGHTKESILSTKMSDLLLRKRFVAASNLIPVALDAHQSSSPSTPTSPSNTSISSSISMDWMDDESGEDLFIAPAKKQRLSSGNFDAIPSAFYSNTMDICDNNHDLLIRSRSPSDPIDEPILTHVRHRDGNLIPVSVTIIPIPHQSHNDLHYCVRVVRSDLEFWQSDKCLTSGYQFSETLGRGAYGKVKRAQDTSTGKDVAVKIMSKQMSTTTTADTQANKNVDMAFREAKILSKLSHPSIVKLHKVVDTPDRLHIVMELVEGEHLMDHITKKGPMSETEGKKIFCQLGSALEYCHSLNICHRDVKPKNIMIDKKGNCKLIDFGLGTWVEEGKFCETFCGTPAFASPEVILGQPYSGPEVDVWSTGVVLYSMLTGKFPFNNVYELLHNDYVDPKGISPECCDLLRKMLVKQPDQRISLREALGHPWCQTQRNLATKRSHE